MPRLLHPHAHAARLVVPLCLCAGVAHAGQVHTQGVSLHEVVTQTLAAGGGIALVELDAKAEQPHAFAVGDTGAKKCAPYNYYRWHGRLIEWLAPPTDAASLPAGASVTVVPANTPDLVALERRACAEGGSKSPIFQRFEGGIAPKGGQRAIAFVRHDATYGWIETVAGAWLAADRADHFRAKSGGSHGKAAHGDGHPAHGHSFKDAEKWRKVFDDPTRDGWQKPDAVVAALSLQPTNTVADLGAGTGYFAVRLARAVPKGKVYAADVEPDMTDHLRKRAAHEKVKNLVPVRCTTDDANLPGPVDVLLAVDTWHHLTDRVAWLGRLRRYLKPGARVAVVDYKLGDIPVGPPAAMRLAPETIAGEFAQAGYGLVRRDDSLLPYQYLLVFTASR